MIKGSAALVLCAALAGSVSAGPHLAGYLKLSEKGVPRVCNGFSKQKEEDCVRKGVPTVEHCARECDSENAASAGVACKGFTFYYEVTGRGSANDKRCCMYLECAMAINSTDATDENVVYRVNKFKRGDNSTFKNGPMIIGILVCGFLVLLVVLYFMGFSEKKSGKAVIGKRDKSKDEELGIKTTDEQIVDTTKNLVSAAGRALQNTLTGDLVARGSENMVKKLDNAPANAKDSVKQGWKAQKRARGIPSGQTKKKQEAAKKEAAVKKIGMEISNPMFSAGGSGDGSGDSSDEGE